MHLFYVDESGSVGTPGQQYFVLAGASVFERQTHWIEQEMNKIAERFSPGNPHAIEFHGSPMRTGSDGWRNFPIADRLQAIKDILQIAVVKQDRNSVRLFGAVVKTAAVVDEDPVEHAFEQISMRFDIFLQRCYLNHNPQRGIMLFDKSSTERRIQTLARDFKYNGHSKGYFRNYAEVPVFLDSKASRLTQLADLVSYALFRYHEHNDAQFYDVIKDCFDFHSGVKQGLYILT